ncbi:hypothetical protein AVT62_gp31 [Streptomyces phage TP1604]|uniref:Uncharacterized protein n=2 Tax=Woodruffvirus TP1604 TaxID=1982746 RepID=A0A1P8VW19_9CAUD|nr:hypothetical protein AVT62_gp31 [Streptomyces phage TP1604]AKA61769.1 hypothetical protein SEA_TP1604_31 [Streptomyces phage TP1604]APZ82199.1 hypothetical protein SEA_BABYGOTBAC_31 [Streptomyces phage BabyGotBac]
MIYFGREDAQMLKHVNEVIGDRLSGDDTYEAENRTTADKLGLLTPPAVLLTGDEMTEADAHALLRRVVNAELDQWVPGASQRLIFRASRALGFAAAEARRADCGAELKDHATITQWVAGLYLRQCVGCARLFRA